MTGCRQPREKSDKEKEENIFILKKSYFINFTAMRSLSKVVSGLPHFSCGQIIKGFGRGSKELGESEIN